MFFFFLRFSKTKHLDLDFIFIIELKRQNTINKYKLIRTIKISKKESSQLKFILNNFDY